MLRIVMLILLIAAPAFSQEAGAELTQEALRIRRAAEGWARSGLRGALAGLDDVETGRASNAGPERLYVLCAKAGMLMRGEGEGNVRANLFTLRDLSLALQTAQWGVAGEEEGPLRRVQAYKEARLAMRIAGRVRAERKRWR